MEFVFFIRFIRVFPSFQQQQQHSLDKLDELEEHEHLDNGIMGKHDDELEALGSGYHSDEDATLDDNKLKNQRTLSQSKKRHLTTQESISDTEFFSQRFDGPGLKNLSKQESIIEEEEAVYPVVEPTKIIPIPRIPTTREVSITNWFSFFFIFDTTTLLTFTT